MAIVTGTNAGFVLTAPTVDPVGTSESLGDSAIGIKVTAPAGVNEIKELGWYQSLASNTSEDFEIALYDHDSGNDRPGNIVSAIGRGTTILNTVGWYSAVIAAFPLVAGATYWIVVQCAATNNYDEATTGGLRRVTLTGQSSLPDPYGVPTTALDSYNAAFYAKYNVIFVRRNADGVIELLEVSSGGVIEGVPAPVVSIIVTGTTEGSYSVRLNNTTFVIVTAASRLTEQIEVRMAVHEVELIAAPSGGIAYLTLDQIP